MEIHVLPRELGNVSDNMFPHCCLTSTQRAASQCDHVARNCFYEHAYGLSSLEGSYTASRPHRIARLALAASNCGMSLDPSCFARVAIEATSNEMPDHKLGPGNQKFSKHTITTALMTPIGSSPTATPETANTSIQWLALACTNVPTPLMLLK
jgi:hypothetical protein